MAGGERCSETEMMPFDGASRARYVPWPDSFQFYEVDSSTS